jgi:hypothetical protein
MAMKKLFWLMLFCGLITRVYAERHADVLEGCAPATVLAKDLQQLVSSDWQYVSSVGIQKKWSMPIEPFKCESEKSCSVMIHNGRIINNRLECVEVFDFKAENAGASDKLSSITIHYTVRTRAAAIEAARTFAKSLGLGLKDVRELGKREFAHFQWETDQFGKEGCSLEIDFTRVQGGWNLFLVFGRQHLPMAD